MLARTFVFGEEGLDVLFARMGLLPAEAAEGAQELDDWVEAALADLWSEIEPVASPEERMLEGGRWHATLQHRDVSGHLLAAEEDTEVVSIGERLERELIPARAVSGFGLRANEPIVLLGQTPTREDLWNEGTRQGLQLGSWQDVPEDVPRDLASTAAWVLAHGS